MQGRVSDVLIFPAADGRGVVTVPPLALGTVVGRTPGVELFQTVQTAPASLSVRVRPNADADTERVRAAVREGIAALLTDLDLAHVTVELAPEPPEQTTGGKYRTVIPLTADANLSSYLGAGTVSATARLRARSPGAIVNDSAH